QEGEISLTNSSTRISQFWHFVSSHTPWRVNHLPGRWCEESETIRRISGFSLHRAGRIKSQRSRTNPIMPLLVVMLVVLLITSATGALVTAAAISGPTLVISPSSGKAGSWAKATGSMFSEEGDAEFPPETIIRFNGIEVASAYRGGSFTLSFQVPSGIPPGAYPVQAIRGSQMATATFTVVTLPVASFA